MLLYVVYLFMTCKVLVVTAVRFKHYQCFLMTYLSTLSTAEGEGKCHTF